MESTFQSYFEGQPQFDLLFDEFDETQDQNQLDFESAEPTVVTDLPSFASDLTAPTLASLNSRNEESENFFNLDFEGDAFNSTIGLRDTDHTYSTKPQTIVKPEPFRSPSPMSMTASVSGSEPSSSPRHSNFDMTDEAEDLLEYLLQDSDIKDMKEDGDEYDEQISPRRRQSVTRSTNIGINSLSGPWCKTKNRKNSKNAVAARENRQKKKQYLQALEDMNLQLSEENSRLKKESSLAKKKIVSLEEEVGYLRKVLFNQSALSGLLKKMDQSDVLLSTNFNGDADKQDEASTSSSSGGVCVHVNGEMTLLKFCASCARKDQP